MTPITDPTPALALLLGWTSEHITVIPHDQRVAFVDRLRARVFDHGERLLRTGEDAPGLHVIVSGEVAVVAHDGGERLVVATLGPGETVGEVELLLWRKASADAVAVRGTVTLFLRRDDLFTLIQSHPLILHGLYAVAVRRHAETRFALESGSAPAAEDCVVEEEEPPVSRAPTVPPPLPQEPVTAPIPTIPAPPPPPPVAQAAAAPPVPPAPPPAAARTPPPFAAPAAATPPPSAASLPPTSLAPTIASLRPAPRPSAAPPPRRSPALRAAAFAAAAAGVFAAALIIARDTRPGSAAAAGVPVATSVAVANEPPPLAPEPAAPLSGGAPAAPVMTAAPSPSATSSVAPVASSAVVAAPRPAPVSARPRWTAPVRVAPPPQDKSVEELGGRE
jgi:hypothetical protein